MENKFATLQILYKIVCDSINPLNYACSVNEIIARHHLPWDVILSHLGQLDSDGLVSFHKGVASAVTITEKGMTHLSLQLTQTASCSDMK